MMSASNKKSTCLHFVATASESALSDCLNQRLEGDAVAFIDAGVMHLLNESTTGAGESVAGFCFSLEDLEARGLTPMARDQGVEIKDARAIARLLFDHRHSLTWK